MLKFLVAASFVVLLVELTTGGPDVVPAVPAPISAEIDPVPASVDGLGLSPVLLTDDLEQPTDVVGAPDDDRLFVVEKAGRIRIVENGIVGDRPFLDMTRWVGSAGNEQGMLSLRFHPRYAENGRIFIFFTDTGGTSQLAEVTVDGTGDAVDLSTLRRIVSIPQFGQYHQSGSMMFGPDGYLWVSLGDGGGIGDPLGNGQNISNIDASIIRIDVDNGDPYAVPDDNPFIGTPDARPEVWAYGVRNPWRISYDPTTGYVYIPDVGQEGSEEINVVPLGEAGRNFGWAVSEGSVCYGGGECDMSGHTLPVYQYLHDGNGCAIIGGQVYRGSLMRELDGHFFFADFCLGWVRSVVLDDSDVHLIVDWITDREDRLGNVTTIGSDRHGELYVANLAGEIWRLELSRR
ncbi:MAG: PQQ-dependent sugar dehydrogenase [Acidimicrobiia bacterium]